MRLLVRRRCFVGVNASILISGVRSGRARGDPASEGSSDEDVAAAGVAEAIQGGGVCASRDVMSWSNSPTSGVYKGREGKGIGGEDGRMGFDIAQM